MYRKWKRQQNANSCDYLFCSGTTKITNVPSVQKKERQNNIPDKKLNRIPNYEGGAETKRLLKRKVIWRYKITVDCDEIYGVDGLWRRSFGQSH